MIALLLLLILWVWSIIRVGTRQWMVIPVLLISSVSYAGDYHDRGQAHRVVYVITDSSGNPVSNQTPSLKLHRVLDGAVMDWSDLTWKTSGWTTKLKTMNYDAEGEYYSYTISLDTARFLSGDIVCIISNDDSTYGDQQAEVIEFDSLRDEVRIRR